MSKEWCELAGFETCHAIWQVSKVTWHEMKKVSNRQINERYVDNLSLRLQLLVNSSSSNCFKILNKSNNQILFN